MKEFKVSETVLDGIMQYLITKPYQEVYKYIHALQTEVEIINKEEE